jgi:hypothetical protein
LHAAGSSAVLSVSMALCNSSLSKAVHTVLCRVHAEPLSDVVFTANTVLTGGRCKAASAWEQVRAASLGSSLWHPPAIDLLTATRTPTLCSSAVELTRQPAQDVQLMHCTCHADTHRGCFLVVLQRVTAAV